MPLPNPEARWIPPEGTRRVTAEEIADRVGPVEGFEVLGGGHANATVRLRDGRVLRIHRRDPAATGKEAALLGRPWSTLRVPAVLERGADFLVLEYVDHAPLEGTADDGAALGRALAEIHRQRFPRPGFLGPDLAVTEPSDDAVEALLGYVEGLADLPGQAAVLRFLTDRLDDLHVGPPVLLHGDFKVSNLHAAGALPLVLDWEFAWAGPALMDVGQLFRWGTPDGFRDAFAAAYEEGGGELPAGWHHQAAAFDVVNLAGLLEGAAPGSQRARDVERRIRSTLHA